MASAAAVFSGGVRQFTVPLAETMVVVNGAKLIPVVAELADVALATPNVCGDMSRSQRIDLEEM